MGCEFGTNRLETLDYGNQDSVSYTYDDQGRLILETYEDGETVRYAYDNSGNLATVTDSETGVVTTYYYDLLNRQSGYRETGASLNHSVIYLYDAKNNLSSMTETVGEVTKTYTYTYNEFNRLTSMTVDGITVEYTYDDFGRLTQQVTKQGETVVLTEPVTYSPGSGTGTTSGQVRTYNGLTYTYDGNGNITYFGDGQRDNNYYQYDSQNQLIRAESEDQNRIQVWTYDNAGNILSRKEYAYSDYNLQTPLESVTYTYGDTEWGDLLTKYDGKAITYDLSGNPETYDGWTYSWKHGKQLVTASDGTTTWNYAYNADGLRTKRASGTDTYTYVYNGSQLSQMTVDGYTLRFTYGASGVPLTVTFSNETYYYVTSLQGDIIGILNASGQQIVTYCYSAWGEVTCIGNAPIGEYNPLLYRGYVYDRETGLYYLQSRYYNPEWGRFLNADDFPATGQGLLGNNMFAYCGNNPVSRSDTSGYFWDLVFDVVSLVVSVVEVVKNPTDVGAWVGLACDVIDVAVPVVSGLGETADAINAARKTADVLDDLHDTGKAIENTGEIIETSSDFARKTDFFVAPTGEVFPANLNDFNSNLSKLNNKNGKYYGYDSKGPIRIRTNEIHPADPNFTGIPDPYHTIPHFHLDRRINGNTGAWKKTYTGPMEMFMR